MQNAICSLRNLCRVMLLPTIMILVSPPFQSARANVVLQSEQTKASSKASEDDVRKLKAGQAVERELRGGESHSYEIELGAGEFVKVVVEQRGIDVAVTAIGLDGKEMFGHNNEPRPQGAEEIFIVAGSAGGYRLRVAASQKAAPAARYDIRIVEARAATETDQALHEARKTNAIFISLRNNGKYDEALPLAEKVIAVREKLLGLDHPDVATTLSGLGILYAQKGNLGKAEPLFQRALAIREKALGAEHPLVARSLNDMANLHADKGELAKAEPLYLREGRGRGEALREVQLRMLGEAKRMHPFYWESFIQSGEWGNLVGKH